MSQQQVAVESGKVVEHTELVPRVSAEYIAAPVEKHIGYIFADIRDKQGNNPDEKENLFGFIACPLYPCREERHIKIQSDEQIDMTGSSSNPVIITNKGTEGRRSEP